MEKGDGCTCIIVNGEYRSTERGGCPVHEGDEGKADDVVPTEAEANMLAEKLRLGHAPPAQFTPWLIQWARGWHIPSPKSCTCSYSGKTGTVNGCAVHGGDW